MENVENKETKSLASEMYEDLKKRNDFNQRLIFVLLGVILALVLALAGTNIYHIYQWSQFDTVVVDSTDGYANYVQGDVTGGVNNGTCSGTQTQEGQE